MEFDNRNKIFSALFCNINLIFLCFLKKESQFFMFFKKESQFFNFMIYIFFDLYALFISFFFQFIEHFEK